MSTDMLRRLINCRFIIIIIINTYVHGPWYINVIDGHTDGQADDLRQQYRLHHAVTTELFDTGYSER